MKLAVPAVVAVALAVGCGGSTVESSGPVDDNGGVERSPKRKGPTQRGQAAWYGGKFHGRKTASGERFDKRELTAAHRTLPFGTRVRVTNLANGKSVVVRINDRGPFGRRRRIIDLSEAAARRLGMIQSGVARVEIEVLERGGGK